MLRVVRALAFVCVHAESGVRFKGCLVCVWLCLGTYLCVNGCMCGCLYFRRGSRDLGFVCI